VDDPCRAFILLLVGQSITSWHYNPDPDYSFVLSNSYLISL